MSDNKEIVLEAMKKAGKPLKAGEVVELTGLKDKEVARLLKDLQAEGAIISPKRCFYAPAK
jgi:DNA-binding IclR family transcriptional regulator